MEVESRILNSDEFFFIVTMPNRSMSNPAQIEIQFDVNNFETQQTEGKTQQTEEKTQLTSLETQLLSESTKETMKEWFRSKAEKNFRETTYEKLLLLLEKYGTKYYFNRQIIANTFSITENAASRIIKKSLECGIMRKEKNGEYYFKTPFF